MLSKLLGNKEHGLVFILSAPAGTGKTTLATMLTEEFPNVKMSVSCTTRAQKPYEKDGEHYHFVTNEEFEKKVQRGEFLEHVTLFGNRYGTTFSHVEEMRAKGNYVLLVIDTQGALQLMQHTQFKACYVFILPPSFEELKRRLQTRGTEDKKVVEERLELAEKEMACADFYEYKIVNDDLDIAYQVLRSIVIAEDHRTK